MLHHFKVLSAVALLIGAVTADAVNSAANFGVSKSQFGNDKLRGVNLGGWLVLEPWITPSLFEQFVSRPKEQQAADEWTFCEKLGRQEAERQLHAHWDNWVTEKDFRDLAAAGINSVRIPIGYWAVDVAQDEPWVQGHLPYMTKAIGWAAKYKMKVIIDLHGAPGSQNGFDNSGKRGDIGWQSKQSNIDRTLHVLGTLTNMYNEQKYPNVIAVELVNEPLRWKLDMGKIEDFYRKGVPVVQQNNPNRYAVIQDAFRTLGEWEEFLTPYKNTKLIMDFHSYQVFNDEHIEMSDEQHLDDICKLKKEVARSQTFVDTFTGEWSLARTDCAKWLNGFLVGARWDGTYLRGPVHPGATCKNDSDIRYFTKEYRQWLKRYAEIQMDAFEAGSGWFFWNFKTEREPQWSYLEGVKQGWIPKDPSKRTYSCEKRW
ncbi:putative Exo-beta-1,3-glucanase [Syncephalis fuscata]|nr:putative Exo-beta-1,3-glucanase [Syncephalis fuscata]